jgi:hypothetical protein
MHSQHTFPNIQNKKKTARTCHTISDVGTELFISRSSSLNIATLAIHNPQAPKHLKDPPLINAECRRNHEKRKTLITCKQQNITKTQNITNAKPRHPQRLMIYCLYFCRFPSFQIAAAVHPLGHSFIQAFTYALFTLPRPDTFSGYTPKVKSSSIKDP